MTPPGMANLRRSLLLLAMGTYALGLGDRRAPRTIYHEDIGMEPWGVMPEPTLMPEPKELVKRQGAPPSGTCGYVSNDECKPLG